jgi:hypothetical protein
MPTPKQMEKLASQALRPVPRADPAPDAPLPDEYWEALLRDPRAAGRPALPIQQRRLSEIPREVLRVECARCSRCVEIQRLDAVRLFGPHAVWKDVAQRLLDDGAARRGWMLAKLVMMGRAGRAHQRSLFRLPAFRVLARFNP